MSIEPIYKWLVASECYEKTEQASKSIFLECKAIWKEIACAFMLAHSIHALDTVFPNSSNYQTFKNSIKPNTNRLMLLVQLLARILSHKMLIAF